MLNYNKDKYNDNKKVYIKNKLFSLQSVIDYFSFCSLMEIFVYISK